MKRNPVLNNYIKQNSGWVFLLVAITALGGWTRGIGASYVGKITNLIGSGSMDSLLPMCITGYLCISLFYIGRTLSAGISAYLAERLSRETRIRIFHHLNRIPFLEYETYGAGRLQSIMQNDVTSASDIIITIFARTLNNLFLFVFSVYHMYQADRMATLIVVVLAIVAALINKLILRYIEKPQRQIRASLADITALTESVFLSMDTIKTLSAGEFILNMFRKEKSRYNRSQMRSEGVDAARLIFYNLLDNISFYSLMVYLGHLAITGKMDLGTVFMFIYLIKQIFVPINTFFRCMSAVVKSQVAWERIYELLELAGTGEEPALSDEILQDIVVESINFSYGGKQNVLADVTVELHRNQINLLLGESGSGKSTLLKILTGMYSSPQAIRYCNGKKSQGGRISGPGGLCTVRRTIVLYEHL